jgi:iron complex outermembrane receptor protein
MSGLNRTPLSLALCTAFALLTSVSTPVLAQDEDVEQAEGKNVNELAEVVVTARRREETLREVPIAVTALTARAIETAGIEDIADLDTEVPNLTIYAARGSSSTVTAYIRGVGQSDPLWGVDPGVGVYLDDVYIARPQGALLDIVDVSRIEVLRGPQGTLYGKNTIGGAIKYITKPLDPEFSGSVGLTLGNYSQQDIRASINTPLGSDALVGRVSIGSFNRDGFGENRITGQQVSDKEILVGRITLGATLSESTNIVLSADWLDDQSGVRGAQRLNAFNSFDPTRTAPLDDRYDVLNDMPNVNDTSMTGASLTANFSLSDAWLLKSVTAWRESDTDTNIDFDLLPRPIVNVRALYSDEQFTQEFQGTYDGGGALSGVIGAYYFNGEAGGTVLNNFLNASFGNTNGVVYTDSMSVYGEGVWRFSDQFSATVGMRYTAETKEADVLNQAFRFSNFTQVIATPADFNSEEDFNSFSPKLSLDYTLADGTLLYGLVSRGFKSGGFNIRANVTAVPRSAEPFDDESVTSFELGTKTAFFDDHVYLNAAIFRNDYKDIQLSVFTAFDSNGDGTDDAFFGDFTNAGEGTVQGAEFEMSARFDNGFGLQANYAYLDAVYDEFIDRGVNIADNQRFTNAPRNSGGITALYTMTAFGGELTARANYSRQSKVYPTTDLSEVIAQDSYGLVNAGLIWRGDANWTLALQGTNLSDKQYRTTGYNIPVLGIVSGFYGPPRQVSLSARYEF